MVVLEIDELKLGMILAEPVVNQQGLRLLEQGTALTKKRIWMLKTWGIEQVCVKGKPRGNDEGAEVAMMETKETIEKELQEKFADVADDPVMAEIMKAAGRQLQKSLNDQNEGNEPT
jgi:DNA-binding ferritin-like protein